MKKSILAFITMCLMVFTSGFAIADMAIDSGYVNETVAMDQDAYSGGEVAFKQERTQLIDSPDADYSYLFDSPNDGILYGAIGIDADYKRVSSCPSCHGQEDIKLVPT